MMLSLDTQVYYTNGLADLANAVTFHPLTPKPSHFISKTKDAKVAGLGNIYRHGEPIALDKLGIQRGAYVKATDGWLGRVDKLLIDPVDHHVTYLVLCEGDGGCQPANTVPVSAIARIEGGVIYLKLDKQRVKHLPALPVRG